MNEENANWLHANCIGSKYKDYFLVELKEVQINLHVQAVYYGEFKRLQTKAFTGELRSRRFEK
jgi:hypothetical protein